MRVWTKARLNNAETIPKLILQLDVDDEDIEIKNKNNGDIGLLNNQKENEIKPIKTNTLESKIKLAESSTSWEIQKENGDFKEKDIGLQYMKHQDQPKKTQTRNQSTKEGKGN